MDLIEILKTVGNLKKIPRTGWVLKKVRDPEHVGDHIFRTVLFTLLFAEEIKCIDKDKAVRMAIFHDLAEALVGDITPHDKVSPERKQELELKAIKKMFKEYANGEKWIQIWEEANARQSKEAKLVRDADLLEMALQAYEYERDQGNKNLEEFWSYVQKGLKLKESRRLFEQLMRMRKKI